MKNRFILFASSRMLFAAVYQKSDFRHKKTGLPLKMWILER